MKSFFTATILGAILALGNGEFVENDSSRRQLAGTIVPRSFIAQVKPEACNSVRARIDELKVSIDGPDAAAREAQARDISYQSDLCFVTFHGGETLKSVVEELPEVDFVEHDTFVQTQVTWGLDRIDQTSLPLDGVNFRGAPDGSGVTVYVIDTGVLSTHPQFQGRATLAFDAVGENGLDGNGHGTHCAGTVGSRDYGVATGATIKGVKVLSAGGSGSNAGVLEGINWSVRDSGSSAAVLSMSLGGGRSTAIDNAVRNAANNGNIVVVAAGNDNSNACNYSPAGAGGNGPSGGVITVGSTTSSDGRSSFSNYGTCVDIFAPGSSITSTWNNGGTRTISGTSMACPHVAGVAAVLLQKNCGNKNAAISELFSLATSNKISDVRGSPNLLLQASLTSGSGCGGGGQPSPTPRPTPTPPTPRPTERSPWTCPNSWFGTGDGCDCECGGGDPDCSRTYTRLYCRGRPASQNQVCDFASDTCVFIRSFSTEDLAASGRTTDAFEAKALEAAAEEPASNSFVVPLAIGCSAFAVVAVGAALFIRRRRASESTVATAQEANSKPVVSASNPVFDTSY